MSSIMKFLSRSRTVNSTEENRPLLDPTTHQRSQSDDVSQQQTCDSGVPSSVEERSSTMCIPASVCEAGSPLEGIVPEGRSSLRTWISSLLQRTSRSTSPPIAATLPNRDSVRIPSVFVTGKGFGESSILTKPKAGGPISVQVFAFPMTPHAGDGDSDGSDTASNSAGVSAAPASAYGISGDQKTVGSALAGAHDPTSMVDCSIQGTNDGHSKGRSNAGDTSVIARYTFTGAWGHTELARPRGEETFLVPDEYRKPIESEMIPVGETQSTPNDYGDPQKHLSDFVAIRAAFKGDASQWHDVFNLAKVMVDHACREILATPGGDASHGDNLLGILMNPFPKDPPGAAEWCYLMTCKYGNIKYNAERTEGWLEIGFKDWLVQMGIPASYT